MSKSRRFQPDRTYHVTHRCHNRKYLMNTNLDRKEFTRLLWRANKRWKVSIYSYTITSNHVHLLLSSKKLSEMSGFMAHVSGGMSRHHNHRRGKVGSFWQGRYRATLIQDGKHLSRCLFYIAMNMVRAGVVDHPGQWPWSSHRELIGGRQRYRLLDLEEFVRRLGCGSRESLVSWYEKTIEVMCEKKKRNDREPWWSEAACVGDYDFVAGFAGESQSRKIRENDEEVYYLV